MAKLRLIFGTFYFITYCACQIHIPGAKYTTNCNLTSEATEDFVTIYKLLVVFLARFDDLPVSSVDGFCAKTTETLNDVLAKSRRDWEPCLKDGWVYYGDFVGETLHNFVDFFCDDDGVNGKKYSNNQSKECRERIVFSRLEQCLQPVYYDNRFNIPGRRDELCRKVEIVKDCTGLLIKEECPSSLEYQKLVESLMEKMYGVCSGYKSHNYCAEIFPTAKMVGRLQS
ncbi:uncharacterized protein LOC132703115 isoform X2 [Cylas formicarius]|uniref:uncharacterized protein LOC132703115 isoform X2 n=1 Tax=Cylas formicarius TaxID=197179 RepID=UPI0029587556|nr:uncharacterized protein LOC132703115 isoform X2 [Cylas formicarius]XP_060528172.1 uncharacterized protein LOC132703115 isoform X2 [Cylas formicarius]